MAELSEDRGFGVILGFFLELRDCLSHPLLQEKAGWFAVGLSFPPSFSALLLAGGVPFFPTTTALRTLSKSRMQVDEGRIRSEVANASSWAEIRMQPCFLWYSFLIELLCKLNLPYSFGSPASLKIGESDQLAPHSAW